MKTIVTKRTRVTENFSLTLEGSEIRKLINQELAATGQPRLPEDADFYVQVPGGADWSNCALDLNDYPVEVRWTIESGEDE